MPCRCPQTQDTSPCVDTDRGTVWLRCDACSREVTADVLLRWEEDRDHVRCEDCGAWMPDEALRLCDPCVEYALASRVA